MRRADAAIRVVSLATFVNGLLGVVHTLFVRFPEQRHLDAVLPFGAYHWSKLLTLLTGFALIDLSWHLQQRKRAAWWLAISVSGLATLAHLGREHHAALALAPGLTAIALWSVRHRFTVRSEARSILQGVALVASAFAIAVTYGAVGFWLLDKPDFDIEFHAGAAIERSVRQFLLLGNSDLTPHTRHARWFLDSLNALGLGAAAFGLFSLYRPLAYRLRTLPHERLATERILDAHGRSALDYFKLWPDKSYHFDDERRAVVAYHSAWGVAIALGDPVGPAAAILPVLRSFVALCENNGWRVAFHQTSGDFLADYRQLGFNMLKIGEEGLVDLAIFASQTSTGNVFRRVRNRARTIGLHVTRHDPPLTPNIVDETEAISTEWLSLPGRRERGFTLGRFDRAYVSRTPVYIVRTADDRALAFLNVIPCWPRTDTTIDLMRHRVEIPNGSMDFLFLEAMLALAEHHRRFSLGLAPLAGVGDHPGASLEERAVHQVYERLNRFFSYKGLRSYKAKFEPQWEERFLVYQGGPAGLAATGIALSRVTEG